MTTYLIFSGAIANIILAAIAILLVWVWFIWPAVEAISMTRFSMAVSKKCRLKTSAKTLLHAFLCYYEPFGRSFDSLGNRYGKWEGVGRWKLFDECEDE
ncbi:hypothetical protein HQN64_20435 [Enterobacteriaceae bacterium BIT-l23]|uniref:hypothetical protein n=1 Tax=Jejubacter sp. L23 TaxID=3092086 RepID=UPI001584F90D|nr:hypothetical protein [Enterobacteriaceae bacterium BIT-l23]